MFSIFYQIILHNKTLFYLQIYNDTNANTGLKIGTPLFSYGYGKFTFVDILTKYIYAPPPKKKIVFIIECRVIINIWRCLLNMCL